MIFTSFPRNESKNYKISDRMTFDHQKGAHSVEHKHNNDDRRYGYSNRTDIHRPKPKSMVDNEIYVKMVTNMIQL